MGSRPDAFFGSTQTVGENDPVRRRAAIDEIFHEDAVFYDRQGGIYRGPDQIDRSNQFRAFLTYANWSDGLRGLVGGIPFQNRTDGLTYGVQAETWW